MPQFDVRLTERREYRVIVEAKDAEAVKEFCWGNHALLRSLVKPASFTDDNVVLSAVKENEEYRPHVKLNLLQRVQDV